MKVLPFFVFLLTASLAVADDTFVELGIGGVSLPSDAQVQSNRISIETEKVSIVLHYAFYEVTVDFTMLNPAEEVRYKVGFPVRSVAGGSGTKEDAYKATAIVGFNTSVDGEPVKFAYQPTPKDKNFSAWYVKDVDFKAKDSTQIQIRYVSEYGTYGSSSLCDYYFGTGRMWNGPIHQLTLSIENTADEKIYNVNMLPAPASRRSVAFPSDNVVELSYADIKPDFDGKFEIYGSYFYGEDFSDGTFDYKLDPGKLAFFTKSQLRIQRNVYFAKHGMIFASDDLNSLFQQRYVIQQGGWYKPTLKNVDKLLTPLDRENIASIQYVENLRASKNPVAQELVVGARSETYSFVRE